MNRYSIKKITMFLSLTIAGCIPAMAQQNIQFTQYMFNSLSVNPAYAGYKEQWFAQMALRTQWEGIKGAPRTGSFSVDGILDPANKRMGLGLQLTTDKLGSQSSVSAYANYAYRLQLDPEDTQRLSFGLGIGMTNYSLDGSMLNPIHADDPEIPTGIIGSYIPDARVGVYYYAPKFYIGASVMDLFSGDRSDNIFRWDTNASDNLKRRRHVYLIAGMITALSDELKLRPSILVKDDFKGPTSVDINGMLIINERIWLGASYRMGLNLWNKSYAKNQSLTDNNSMSGLAQFYISSKLRLGYSYDYMLNSLRTEQSGSHEITLGLTFGQKSERVVSPRFF